MPDATTTTKVVGFAPDEIDPTVSTREARLKWVIVVNDDLPPGRAVNAAVCVAAATSTAVTGLMGDDAVDAAGQAHPGIPWIGCSILAADTATLRTVRAKAIADDDCHVADFPAVAQRIRVYADYLATMKESAAEDIDYYAVSIVGPRRRVDKIVRKLSLLA